MKVLPDFVTNYFTQSISNAGFQASQKFVKDPDSQNECIKMGARLLEKPEVTESIANAGFKASQKFVKDPDSQNECIKMGARLLEKPEVTESIANAGFKAGQKFIKDPEVKKHLADVIDSTNTAQCIRSGVLAGWTCVAIGVGLYMKKNPFKRFG